MKNILKAVLIAVAVIAGVQFERMQERPLRASDAANNWIHGKFEITHGLRDGTRVDIQVQDANHTWKTLAFAAVFEGTYSNLILLTPRKNDAHVVHRIEPDQLVRIRPTVYPGSTRICMACTKSLPHDGLIFVGRGNVGDELFRIKFLDFCVADFYECRHCRTRIVNGPNMSWCTETTAHQRLEDKIDGLNASDEFSLQVLLSVE